MVNAARTTDEADGGSCAHVLHVEIAGIAHELADDGVDGEVQSPECFSQTGLMMLAAFALDA